MTFWQHIARAVCVVLAGFAVTACSLAPQYRVPETASFAAYKEDGQEPPSDVGTWAPAEPADGTPRSPWWTAFGDIKLDQLEQQAADANQTLAGAAARYREARAAADAAGSQLFPVVNLDVSGQRDRISKNAPTNSTGAAMTTSDYVLRAQSSYEIDFWGRVRNTVAAAHGRAQASAADLATALLLIQNELTADYMELRGLDAQVELLASTVEAYGEALRITQNRYSGGAAALVDLEQAKTQLETARVQLADAKLSRVQMEHAVAILVGAVPANFTLAAEPLRLMAPRVASGLPSQLLERRSDVASAERQVFAANAEIGVARAAWFPTFSLDGGIGFEGDRPGNWFDAPSLIWSVGPSMAFKVLDWGLRRAQNDQAVAAYDEMVAQYRQTVLQAFREVEDQLAAIHSLDVQLEAQERAVVSSQSSLDQSNYRYRGGIATYLEVVVAQNANLQARQSQLNLRVRRLNAAVQLVKALGGDWSKAELDTPLSQAAAQTQSSLKAGAE